MRTIIELPDDQLQALADLCEAAGISRAEAIRRAVRAYTRQHRRDGVAQAFGLWRQRRVGGLAYERRLREEW